MFIGYSTALSCSNWQDFVSIYSNWFTRHQLRLYINSTRKPSLPVRRGRRLESTWWRLRLEDLLDDPQPRQNADDCGDGPRGSRHGSGKRGTTKDDARHNGDETAP